MVDLIQLREVEPADDADVVLEEAKGEVKDVLLLGYNKDGELYAAATPYFANCGNVLWLLENFKAKLIARDFSGD